MKIDWARLAAGETLVGAFLSTASAVNAEVMGLAGFDFLIADLEHGAGSERDSLAQLHALADTPAAAVFRVESHEKQRVHRLLDLGAHGIMFPRVESAEQARACVAAMRYPPDGVRGVAAVVRASGYGRSYAEYYAASKTSLLTIVQIESSTGLDRVDEIAQVEGIQVLFIGPMDLSASLGIFGQYEDPRFVEALRKTAAAAAQNGKAAGILLRSPAEAPRYAELGYRFLTCGSDVSLLRSASEQLARQLRGV